MTGFKDTMKRDQICWRRKNLSNQTQGLHNGEPYDHVLPTKEWELNLWPNIRHSLEEYLDEKSVQKHTGSHNLLSSWVVCANLFFPFRHTEEGHQLLRGFLGNYVHNEIAEVVDVDLEFALKEPLDPVTLLGEPVGGVRGSGQTSPDVAFTIRTNSGSKGLILTESKFTEHSFYKCSGYTKKESKRYPEKPTPERCLNASNIISNPKEQCRQVKWGRMYWEHLRPVISEDGMRKLKCCPAAKGGYQLFRQQALAEAIIASPSSDYKVVSSCVAYDERNDILMNCLRSTGIYDIESGWPTLFKGRAGFAMFTHQQWVNWVHKHDSKEYWKDWLRYVGDRYGYKLEH